MEHAGEKMTADLGNISSPADIKGLSIEQLKELCGSIRQRIIEVTAQKGGHLASSLGAVELAVAIHYCMESPRDRVIWDVGHQSYAHKLITGRAARFGTLREMGGLSGFPKKDESEHDPFTCGHSATSISSALGLAKARDLRNEKHKVVAVIGDASLASGLAFEGMNQAGHIPTNLMVVLNDNEHSISKPVGAMSKYLNNVITNPLYNRVREEAEKIVKGIPRLGTGAHKAVRKFQEGVKNLLVPGIVFEELGFRYFGPVDGHDLEQLIHLINNIKTLKEPVMLHTITKKGKGYAPAEKDPVKFHGLSCFDPETGNTREDNGSNKTFTGHFGAKVTAIARKDSRIAAITAAMPDGTGLSDFAAKYPERFFDVGIMEPHAVTFAAGLAAGGMRPVVAIYSTFLQRSYDQLIHDVALQALPVVFCVDRAGLVGKDGPTHHGLFDISYTRGLPGFLVMAPKDGEELELMLEKAVEWGRPAVIRYPKGDAERIVASSSCVSLEIGVSETLRKGRDAAVIALGSMVNTALRSAEVLCKKGVELEVINARFAKPLDKKMLEHVTASFKKIFTLEEGICASGFGSAVLEFCERENITGSKIHCLGLPDEFIEHGARQELLRKYHLTPDEVASTIASEL